MSSTFGELKTEVSEALRDPDLLTFDDAAVGRLVNMGIAQIGRVSPEPFQEDIAPLADTLEYVLRENEFGGDTVPEIELSRVEMWDTTTTPYTRRYVVPAASAGYIADSETGWMNWGGTLSLPRRIQQAMAGMEDNYLIRVWGYSPYPELFAEEDLFAGGTELKWAVVMFGHLSGLRRLVNERELFSQWQTRSGNVDTTFAGLMADYNSTRDEWRREKHELYRHRSKV